MNQLTLHGRLTKDPEFKVLDSGQTLCNFSIAVARRGNPELADFFDCTAWGKTADFIMKYFFRGKEILVSGRMESHSYVNFETNKKTYYWRVQVEQVDFCGKANDVEQQSNSQVKSAEQSNAAGNASASEPAETFLPIQDDDDLPF